MAKAPPPHPRISCMASTSSWTTAHLNTSRVLNYSLGSLNRGQSAHPKHAWKVFLIHNLPAPPTWWEVVAQCTDFLIFGNEAHQEGSFCTRDSFVLVKRTHFSSHLQTNFFFLNRAHIQYSMCVRGKEEALSYITLVV